jgi:hypothetical protein
MESHRIIPKIPHAWLHTIRLAYVPGPSTPVLEEFGRQLLKRFSHLGQSVLPLPEGHVDVLLTTAAFGQPVHWREAKVFTARREFRLDQSPTVFTILQATPDQLKQLTDHFAAAVNKSEPDPEDFDFPGLTPRAYMTLFEQGRRGGPLLSVVRLLQAQAMSIRLILVVGVDHPQEAYLFDLVGAHPRGDASDGDAFYDDIAFRILTAVSTHEITDHQIKDRQISRAEWTAASAPQAMIRAGVELGSRNFFTEMVQVGTLVNVPTLNNVIANQYSEGCYATWDPGLNALVTTVTGSARPVAKDQLTEHELAVIGGIRPDKRGALIQHVEGLRNDPPSSEAVELIAMDEPLPRVLIADASLTEARITDARSQDSAVEVPVVRSKLHGHRGVASYDPRLVEHVYMDPPFYHYPVSCSTEAQANGILSAFTRSQALTNPEDPRQIVFTVLPGHGVVIVEKWVPGKGPFQVIWEAMDNRTIQIDNDIPQGPLEYLPGESGRMVLHIP